MEYIKMNKIHKIVSKDDYFICHQNIGNALDVKVNLIMKNQMYFRYELLF